MSQAQMDFSASLASKLLSWYLLVARASSGKVSSTGKAGKSGSERLLKGLEPLVAEAVISHDLAGLLKP